MLGSRRWAVRGVERLLRDGVDPPGGDAALLHRYLSGSDESAFEAIVDRHGPLVLSLCRRYLREPADVEDAFQATFLVLVRRAGSVRVDGRGSAGRWLYGVARKVSARLRREAARRLPAPAEPSPADDPSDLAERREVRDAVVAELDRLPAKYRRPIELCDFEGLTYEQAGLSLGCPTATIKSRLARGRLRLRRGLSRRGLAPSGVVVAAALAEECRAGVPKALIPSTLRACALASGLIPGVVAGLAEGVLRTMLWDKIKLVALLAITIVGTASVYVAAAPGRNVPQEAPKAPPADPAPPAPGPDPRYTRTLSDGTEVEILAISEYGPDPKTWWRPDGTPLAEAPCDSLADQMNRSMPRHSVAERRKRLDGEDARKDENQPPEPEVPAWPWGRDKVGREILFRVSDDRANVTMGKPPFGGGFHRRVTKGGKVIPNVRLSSEVYPKDQPTGTARLYSDHVPWTKHGRVVDIGSSGTMSVPHDTSSSLFFTSSYDDEGHARITVVHGFKPNTIDYQVRVVDVDGEEHFSGAGNGAYSEQFQMHTSIFKVPRERFREFRILTKPIEAIEFHDIALNPRKADDPR